MKAFIWFSVIVLNLLAVTVLNDTFCFIILIVSFVIAGGVCEEWDKHHPK